MKGGFSEMLFDRYLNDVRRELWEKCSKNEVQSSRGRNELGCAENSQVVLVGK